MNGISASWVPRILTDNQLKHYLLIGKAWINTAQAQMTHKKKGKQVLTIK